VGRVLGFDPARAIVERANAAGVPTICGYFGPETADAIAAGHGRADVVVARHCAAHNADAHSLVEGARRMLAGNGVFAMENAYALETVVNCEIAQIYHEHMFYFYARPIQRLFEAHGLDLVDLMPTPVHGGSMVFFGAPAGSRPVQPVVEETIARERLLIGRATLDALAAYPETWRREVRALVDRLRAGGATIALYGASAKAATFVNVVGLTADDIVGCADSTEIKVGRYIPGPNIIIRSEQELIDEAPDYFMITAWNYTDEIIAKVRRAGNDRTQFISVFPKVCILNGERVPA
jgi:hypothetical protein